jgi:serine phosphatase RsbU (regulator of sigma subunit)
MPWKDPLRADAPSIRDAQLAAVYYGQRRGGDFYDFIPVSSERVLFGLFDVAGDLAHTRAIILAVQEKFRDLGSQLLGPSEMNEPEALIGLWIELNRSIMQAAGGVHPCPAFLGCYNEDVKTLSYINAGHTPGLVRDGQEVTELNATSLPMGLFSHSVPDSSVIALEARNTALVISRGVVEAGRHGDEFGLERAKQYLLETVFDNAHETCVGLLARVQQHMGTAPTHNDVTALSLIRSS